MLLDLIFKKNLIRAETTFCQKEFKTLFMVYMLQFWSKFKTNEISLKKFYFIDLLLIN